MSEKSEAADAWIARAIAEADAVAADAQADTMLVNVYHLVGLSEIRTIFDVREQTVHMWRTPGRNVLPEPLPRKVSGRPMWHIGSIFKMAEVTGRTVVNPWPWPADDQEEVTSE